MGWLALGILSQAQSQKFDRKQQENTMKVQALGHAVLNVRDLARSEQFYQGILGIPVVARSPVLGGMTFFSLGNHHDLAIHQAESEQAHDWMKDTGLFHLAFKVGDSLAELRAAKEHLEAAGVPIELVADHDVTCSVYLRDPDGNGVELYVDTSDSWKTNPDTVASFQPLQL